MSASIPTYTFTDRADLIAYVPYMLGFHPADSVVVIGLRGRRISVGARADVTTPAPETLGDFARLLTRAGRRGAPVTTAMLVGYGPHTAAAERTRELAQGLEQRGYHIAEALHRDGDRFHCLRCADCTPPEGELFDLSTTAAAAAATFEGMTVLPDRESVLRLVEPVGNLAAIAMAQAVDRAELRLITLLAEADDEHEALRTAGTAAIDRAMDGFAAGGRLDDDEAAWLSLVLHDLPCRDHAWSRTDDADWQLDFWLDLTRRSEPGLVAPIATLLGWCAWRGGNGVLAGAALERALRTDPDYSLAHLLTGALAQGLPPHTISPWPADPNAPLHRHRTRPRR
ncbi:DUF4192 domain-containing protein [Catellatospora sp. KI3]|uniref:DUF4192 domain-containing protein n=1 Tax=Catellatospora sp. KI3 TaxID=3041620 RepID=UPI002482F161|nr:DUF4192 domain-containing protein [Catellatospora sp. KI3]MDI1461718.1 DUF4192 domain-containing protein [Catellatospora sp. KI3]